MKLRTGEPWMPAPDYGRQLRGLTVNLLVREIESALVFQRAVLRVDVVYCRSGHRSVRGATVPNGCCMPIIRTKVTRCSAKLPRSPRAASASSCGCTDATRMRRLPLRGPRLHRRRRPRRQAARIARSVPRGSGWLRLGAGRADVSTSRCACGWGGVRRPSRRMCSYSAITCAPSSSTSDAISSVSSTTIDVVSEP